MGAESTLNNTVSYAGALIGAGLFGAVYERGGDVEALGIGAYAEIISTVENFASFNRQVTEAMTGREIIVYTGGFPSRATISALRRLLAASGLGLRHWGDQERLDPVAAVLNSTRRDFSSGLC